MRHLRRLVVAVATAVVALIVLLLLRDPAPEAVDLTAPAASGVAAEDVTGGDADVPAEPDEGPAAATEAAAAVIDDPSGTWTVRTDLVAFDGESGAGSWVGYRIDEELATVGAFTAVGRTPDVLGTVVLDGTAVVSARVEADLATLRSDSGSRDGQVRRRIGDRAAVFELDGPLPFEPGAAPEASTLVEAPGRLRIGDVEREVTVMLSAALDGDVLVVRGVTDVVLAEFDVEVPRAAIVLSVSEVAAVELQLLLTRD